MSKLKFLVMDCGGLHTDTARKLGQEGHEVYYWVPWYSAYPKFESYAPGTGIPEITKVMDWGPYADQADAIIFPDVGMGGMHDYLRSKGYNVFGAGSKGEAMEQNRFESTKVMKQIGLKYPKTYEVNGLDEAQKLIETVLGQRVETNQIAPGKLYAKFDIWRGSLESFPVQDAKSSRLMFDSVRNTLGPYANRIPMVLQEAVDGVETGADLFFNGERFIGPYMWGFESGGNYLGNITEDLGFLAPDLDKVAEYLKSIGYIGAFSYEAIFDGQDCHWIDWTCRFPMPLGLMYATFIPNFGEFLYKMASGQAESTGLPLNKYIGVAEMSSEEGLSKYVKLEGNEHSKFMRHMMDEDNMYTVPGTSTLGVVTAQGDTIAQFQENLTKNCEGVSAYFGSLDPEFVDTVKEKYLMPLKEFGITFGPDSDVYFDQMRQPSMMTPQNNSRRVKSKAERVFEEIERNKRNLPFLR